VTALQDIFGGGFQADKVLERQFKGNKKLGSRDRRFIAETTYEIVRHWRNLWVTMGYQEPSLSSFDLTKLIGAHMLLNGETLPPWDEFEDLEARTLISNQRIIASNPAVRESVPDWLYEYGLKEIGPEWEQMLHALNEPAPVCIRANRLKTTREELAKILLAEGIETRIAEETEDGLILLERSNIFTTDAFKKGLFEIQDGASQQVAPMTQAKPGDRVIDACAGGGGKTLHLAAMMKNKGKIISMDITERKLQALRTRCTRAGVDIAEVRLIENAKTIKRLEKTADRVLLDVPCTGMGVLRRNPDKKWKISLEEIERLEKLQSEILYSYSEMVKAGGTLVYATCSCLPSENENQVANFLKTNANSWELLEEKKFSPGHNGYDGFYAATLKRKS
ncbi:MAG: methyltransferase domain-containing protein, partial [Proteobacteria bacterium]